MKKLGLITIGQSPRTDVLPDIEPIFGREIELHHAGALDGLTKEEIRFLSREEGLAFWDKPSNSCFEAFLPSII